MLGMELLWSSSYERTAGVCTCTACLKGKENALICQASLPYYYAWREDVAMHMVCPNQQAPTVPPTPLLRQTL